MATQQTPTARNQESTSGVNYHVSDFLKDRHPYVHQTGFGTQRERDAGKVMNGLLPGGIDRLLDAINDQSLEPMQKAVALKHLFAHSASAENKIILLRKGIVPMLAAIILAKPIPAVEQLSAQLLRSLAILPQGSHCVVVEGGVASLCSVLSNRESLDEREEARIHAASAIQQIASNWDGRAWLLGLEVSADMQLLGREIPQPTQLQSESLAQAACDVLVSVVEKDVGSPRMLFYAVHALALLTTVPRGLELCLISGALRATTNVVLDKYAQDDTWVYRETSLDCDIVLHSVTIVWHMALDEIGKEEAVQLPLVAHIARLIAFTLPLKEKLFPLKSALAGGVCALAMHSPNKMAAVEPLAALQARSEPTSLLDLMVSLLVQANDIYEPMHRARKQNQKAPPEVGDCRIEDAQGAIKNSVQAIRLICEWPKAREHMKVAVPEDKYNLRRQIFYLTAWQEDFGVKPV